MDTTVEFRIDGEVINPDVENRPILVEIFSNARIAKMTLRSPERRNAPVSYTHLRAHET